MSASDAITIIQDYGYIMLHQSPPPFYISDVRKLPHTKERIKQALLLALNVSGKPQMMDALKVGYLQLANWQEGIGEADFPLGMIDKDETEVEKFRRVKKHLVEVKRWGEILVEERTELQSDLMGIGVW